jgi:hypothetical protein
VNFLLFAFGLLLDILLVFNLPPLLGGIPANIEDPKFVESNDVSEPEVNHIATDRLYELVQMSQITIVVNEPEWEHIRACEDCSAAFLMLKHVVERSRTTVC